jgi:hypothetical protein
MTKRTQPAADAMSEEERQRRAKLKRVAAEMAKEHPLPSDDFHAICEDARYWLEKLKEAEGKPWHFAPRNITAEAKAAAIKMLASCSTPAPLTVLVAELFKERGQKENILGEMSRENKRYEAKLCAARIEASYPIGDFKKQPSILSTNKLRKLMNGALGNAKDYRRSIKRWREDDPTYWRLVFEHRPDWFWQPERPNHNRRGGGAPSE